MKSVRFTNVVEKCGKPEVYLLMSETDPDFQHALEAGKIMSLSDDSHGAGTEYGTVGYVKKHHGQLLRFPKSLKAFANTKIIGIKYGLLAEEPSHDENGPRSSHTKKQKEIASRKAGGPKRKTRKEPEKETTEPERSAKKIIPFPAKGPAKDDDVDSETKTHIRQAMRALEKGNPVAAYNILKRLVP